MVKRNIALYPVEEEILNRALESPNGIVLRHTDLTKDFAKWSINTRHRLNQCREADRQRNSAVYPEGHPLHNKSPFDGLAISIDAAASTIKIIPRLEELNSIVIEDL